MPIKSYKKPEDTPETVAETTLEYRTATTKTSSSTLWNPNKPFIGTQEEWWEHFHRIEQGEFMLVSDVHQKVSKWLDNQKL
jgi:hypothetical protein